MNRRLYSAICIVLLFCSFFLLISCGKSKFDKIPRTAFIKHYEENTKGNPPFLSVWVNENLEKKLMNELKKENSSLSFYIKPVNLDYLAKSKMAEKYKDSIEDVKKKFDEKLLADFQKKASGIKKLNILSKPSSKAYTLEVAITSIRPTPVGEKIVTEALGVLDSLAGTVGGTVKEKGHIAMSAKFCDPTGKSLAEIADYSTDKSALLIDFNDFSRFAHHRKRVAVWARDLADTFTSPPGTKIKGEPRVVLVRF